MHLILFLVFIGTTWTVFFGSAGPVKGNLERMKPLFFERAVRLKNRRTIEEQWPDAISLLHGALKAGLNLEEALQVLLQGRLNRFARN